MVNFKIVYNKPPKELWEKLVNRFGVSWGRVIVTYGDTVYSSGPLPDDLLMHEGIHVRQQADFGDKDLWWERYLNDDQFRFSQELEAYRAQWIYLKKSVKDRNVQAWHLVRISNDFSSFMYGSILSFKEAKKAITSTEPVEKLSFPLK